MHTVLHLDPCAPWDIRNAWTALSLIFISEVIFSHDASQRKQKSMWLKICLYTVILRKTLQERTKTVCVSANHIYKDSCDSFILSFIIFLYVHQELGLEQLGWGRCCCCYPMEKIWLVYCRREVKKVGIAETMIYSTMLSCRRISSVTQLQRWVKFPKILL